MAENTTTVAFELVTTAAAEGHERLRAEGHKVRSLLEKHNILNRVNSLLIPQLIDEDDGGDRPIKLTEKIDPLEAKPTLAKELPVDFIVTQVTAFTPEDELRKRLTAIREAGINRVVFVGVPRVFDEKNICGPFPNQAMKLFEDVIPSRGVILIPTRPDEEQRFAQKAEAGATFGLTQLLFSDQIVPFLRKLSEQPHRPEILLSFGYVPKLETKNGLINWLIHDSTPGAQRDMAEVARLSPLSLAEKRQALRDLVRRVVEPIAELGFPLGLHYECPYGVSEPAIDCFAAVLEEWDRTLGK